MINKELKERGTQLSLKRTKRIEPCSRRRHEFTLGREDGGDTLLGTETNTLTRHMDREDTLQDAINNTHSRCVEEKCDWAQ